MGRKDQLPTTLESLGVGDRHYIDVLLAQRRNQMTHVTGCISRIRDRLGDRQFTTKLFTAVGRTPGDVRYLVCVERTS
jgi:hypothetical protein